ncbi:MAG: potassium channel family protein [Planctomycetales bacterium]|nr:potassium channel family protein [Planctomycetales bacterium]
MTDTRFTRRLAVVVVAIITLMVVGTLGYTFIESWPLRDGFYMTVITLSTVGYGEPNTLSPEGRAFTAAFIVLCLFTMALWSATLTSCLVEGDLTGRFQERKNKKMINKLQGHAVVCGSDAMASALISRLLRKRIDVVVIDSNVESLEHLKSAHRRLLTVVGDPTNELELSGTNILNAGMVVALMESELDNLLVAISSKSLGGGIQVLARADNFSIANRMRKAGVDTVITPSEICGDSIAQSIEARRSQPIQEPAIAHA